MKRIWLLLDVNYLAYRAFHTYSKLSFGNVGTGVTFGVLSEALKLQDQHATRNVVWTFDHGKGLRKEVFPGYKKKRHDDKTPEQIEAWKEVRKQVHLLKTEYLPYLGYENVFYQWGYEADDVIASVCERLPPKDEAVIVSGDGDLYQLLQDNVCVWNPNSKAKVRCMTAKTFRKTFGIFPDQWRMAKAIAGCATDEIPGVKGVREKLACRYLNATMKDPGKEEEIRRFMKGPQFQRNLDLVRLPYTGTKEFVPIEDEVDKRNWSRLMKRLGMKSLMDKYPGKITGFGFRKVLMHSKK